MEEKKLENSYRIKKQKEIILTKKDKNYLKKQEKKLLNLNKNGAQLIKNNFNICLKIYWKNV